MQEGSTTDVVRGLAIAHKAGVAFGSNLGNRRKTIELAIEAMTARSIKIVKRSSLLETEAWIHPDDDADWHPPFLNGMALIETEFSAFALLDHLLQIERVLGRSRNAFNKPWQPRPIDLDLICFDDLVLDTPKLILPHPRMHQRDFVLSPLVEIWPNWQHPIRQKSASDLLAELSTQ